MTSILILNRTYPIRRICTHGKEEGIGTFDLHQQFESPQIFKGTVFENYCKKSHFYNFANALVWISRQKNDNENPVFQIIQFL